MRSSPSASKQFFNATFAFLYQHDAKLMPASAFFSCNSLNASLEPHVCGIYATRLPRLRLPRLRLPRLTLNMASPCTLPLSLYTLSLPLYTLSLCGLLLLALSFSLLFLFLSPDFFLSLSLSFWRVYALVTWILEIGDFTVFFEDLGKCFRFPFGFSRFVGSTCICICILILCWDVLLYL